MKAKGRYERKLALYLALTLVDHCTSMRTSPPELGLYSIRDWLFIDPFGLACLIVVFEADPVLSRPVDISFLANYACRNCLHRFLVGDRGEVPTPLQTGGLPARPGCLLLADKIVHLEGGLLRTL